MPFGRFQIGEKLQTNLGNKSPVLASSVSGEVRGNFWEIQEVSRSSGEARLPPSDSHKASPRLKLGTKKVFQYQRFIRSLPKNFLNNSDLLFTKYRVLVGIHPQKFTRTSPKTWEDKFLGIPFLSAMKGIISDESKAQGTLLY